MVVRAVDKIASEVRQYIDIVENSRNILGDLAAIELTDLKKELKYQPK